MTIHNGVYALNALVLVLIAVAWRKDRKLQLIPFLVILLASAIGFGTIFVPQGWILPYIRMSVAMEFAALLIGLLDTVRLRRSQR